MLTDKEHKERYANAIRQAHNEGAAPFQSWFNQSENIQESVMRGFWDFAIHILTPEVCSYINAPKAATALEIGYGGGRILNAACCFFSQAIGVDIHEEEEAVAAFLREQGKTNFRLLRTSGRTIDVEAGHLDLVYSFIALQHLPTFEVFEAYLRESFRCLKPGGIAQLYFGRYATKLSGKERWKNYWRGYKEITNAPVNHTSLVIRVVKAARTSREIGFELLASGCSYKRVPDGYPAMSGGQNYITLRKPL